MNFENLKVLGYFIVLFFTFRFSLGKTKIEFSYKDEYGQVKEIEATYPGSRSKHAFMLHSPTRGTKAFLFGGYGYSTVGSSTPQYLCDFWEFDMTTNLWSLLSTSSCPLPYTSPINLKTGSNPFPSGRSSTAHTTTWAQDLNNGIYMYGGKGASGLNCGETWRYLYDTKKWQYLPGHSCAGDGPKQRINAALEESSTVIGLLMFGGETETSLLSDLWMMNVKLIKPNGVTGKWARVDVGACKGDSCDWKNRLPGYGEGDAGYPGSRAGVLSWKMNDNSGKSHLFVYGGYGYAKTVTGEGKVRGLCDMFKIRLNFPGNEGWSFVSGGSCVGVGQIRYGFDAEIGYLGSGNPGAREYGAGLTGTSQMGFIFGGGPSKNSDLWQYNVSGVWSLVHGGGLEERPVFWESEEESGVNDQYPGAKRHSGALFSWTGVGLDWSKIYVFGGEGTTKSSSGMSLTRDMWVYERNGDPGPYNRNAGRWKLHVDLPKWCAKGYVKGIDRPGSTDMMSVVCDSCVDGSSSIGRNKEVRCGGSTWNHCGTAKNDYPNDNDDYYYDYCVADCEVEGKRRGEEVAWKVTQETHNVPGQLTSYSYFCEPCQDENCLGGCKKGTGGGCADCRPGYWNNYWDVFGGYPCEKCPNGCNANGGSCHGLGSPTGSTGYRKCDICDGGKEGTSLYLRPLVDENFSGNKGRYDKCVESCEGEAETIAGPLYAVGYIDEDESVKSKKKCMDCDFGCKRCEVVEFRTKCLECMKDHEYLCDENYNGGGGSGGSSWGEDGGESNSGSSNNERAEDNELRSMLIGIGAFVLGLCIICCLCVLFIVLLVVANVMICGGVNADWKRKGDVDSEYKMRDVSVNEDFTTNEIPLGQEKPKKEIVQPLLHVEEKEEKKNESWKSPPHHPITWEHEKPPIFSGRKGPMRPARPEFGKKRTPVIPSRPSIDTEKPESDFRQRMPPGIPSRPSREKRSGGLRKPPPNIPSRKKSGGLRKPPPIIPSRTERGNFSYNKERRIPPRPSRTSRERGQPARRKVPPRIPNRNNRKGTSGGSFVFADHDG